MNYENIIMTKAEREAMLERVEVLQKVKTLLLIPRLYMATTQQVADFFEVEIVAVQKCYQRNKKELDGNGVKTYKAAELNGLLGQDVQAVDAKGKRIFCVGDDFYFDATYSGTKFFPPRAILNMAMLLTDSRIAREVRNQLLNITENATPAARVVEIEREQDLQMEIGKAFASGNIAAFAEAAQKYTGYLNRNLASAQEKAVQLEKEKAALNAANALLAENALIWEPRATLNALIRAIAASAFDHKYSLAWDKFYRELKYRTGIHITSRAESKSGKLVLDGVREDEWPRLLKVAASLCYDYCVDVVYATNEETVSKYKLDTIETEFGVRRNRGTTTRKMNEVS